MSVGEKIRYHRKLRKMTQEELGKILGVGKAAIQKYESGQVQNLKSGHIAKLSELFQLPPWEFVFDDEVIDTGQAPLELTYEIRSKHGDQAARTFEVILKLNSAGQQKLTEYAKDLAKIDEYAD